MAFDRPKARRPAGFEDATAELVAERVRAVATLVGTYEKWGFSPLETPAIEYLDILGKHLPDIDAPDQGVFALRDDDEQWIALRYDLTAPLARYVAEHRQSLPTPFRRYQVGPVWRREKPGPGRFRQFVQCDFDTVGSSNPNVEAEACALLSSALDELGIEEHQVRVNDRKILNGVLAASGVNDTSQQSAVLRSVDKLDRLGLDAVTALLGEGRKDASGDFTEGAGLTTAQIDLVAAFVNAGDPSRQKVLASLSDLVGADEAGREGIAEMAAISDGLDAMGYGDRVIFDPTVVRGLAYYTGPVFEAALTFEITDEKGRPREFGSVAGGGRYDDLITRFTGQAVPSCGASIGIDRLLAALRTRSAEAARRVGPVVITVMDDQRLADYWSMAKELRAAGISTEVYAGNQNFQKQLRYADRRGAPAVVIAGSDEFEAGQVQIKDLVAGAERATEISDRDEWRADRSAQVSVGRDQLVATIQGILFPRPSL